MTVVQNGKGALGAVKAGKLAIWLIAANLTIVSVFELTRSRQLSWDGLWNARTAVWAALLLLDNLLVVWWYATLTRSSLAVATTQADTAARQFELSRQQFELSRHQYEVQLRPRVTIFEKRLGSEGDRLFCRNIGFGAAVSVYVVEPLKGGQRRVTKLGALEARSERQLPSELEYRVRACDAVGILAESESPTERWLLEWWTATGTASTAMPGDPEDYLRSTWDGFVRTKPERDQRVGL